MSERAPATTEAHTPTSDAPGPPKRPTQVGEQLVWFDAQEPVSTPIYARAALPPGTVIYGPAIIDEYSGTTIVPPSATARVADEGGALILETKPS